MRHLSTHRSTRGNSVSAFTLIELVVVMVVLSIIGLATSFVVMESMRVYARTMPRMDAHYQARLAVDRLREDLRALADPATISVFMATDVAFERLDGERVRYTYLNGLLRRNGVVLASGLGSLEFNYLEQSGAQALSQKNLHRFEIEFVLERSGEKLPIYLSVFPRVRSS